MSSWRDSIRSFSALKELCELLCAAEPAWVWAPDGSRVLWANAAGGLMLGANRFEILWERRWAPTSQFRRSFEGVARRLPLQGTLARLRLLGDPWAVPLGCRCKRVRAGEARGVLVVGLAARPRAPEMQEIVRFFGDDSIAAELLGATAGISAREPDAMSSTPGAAQTDVEIDAHDEFRAELARIAPRRASAAVADDAEPVEGPTSAAAGETGGPDRVASGVGAPNDERAPAAALPDIGSTQPGASETEPPPRRSAQPAVEVAPAPAAAIRGLAPGPRRRSGAHTAASEKVALAEEPEPDRSVRAGRVQRELLRKPVRFLWQTDAADRFLFVSPGLAQVVGRNAEIVGERWQDLAARLRLDPTSRITRALAQRDTWSGQTAWWPVEGSNVRVPAELTALPVFGSDRSFQGYRGFGVLRSAEALMPGAFETRFGASDTSPARPVEQVPPYEETAGAGPANVVPIRADLERRPDSVRLTPQERSAFEEIAAALRQRVESPAHALSAPLPEPSTSEPSTSEPQTEPALAEDTELVAAALPVPNAGDEGRSEAVEPPRGEEPIDATGAPGAPEEGGSEAPPDCCEGVAEPSREPPPSPATVVPVPPAGSPVQSPWSAVDAEAILDGVADGALILDTEGVITAVNSGAESLFGLEGSELRGVGFVDLLAPASRDLILREVAALRSHDGASRLREGREVEAPVGPGSMTLRVSMTPLSGEGDGRICVVLRDVTAWKRNETQLIAARQLAEAASAQKSEFLARVSHEIRTPLNAIVGFAEVMIEERFGPVANERYREYLHDIRNSGEHVVSLVNDLLDIAKIEAGKLDLQFTAVPLNDLLREAIAVMQPQAGRAQVVLRSSLSREVPAIVADQRTLRQIVFNLLSNSVKFTGPGGQVIASTSLTDSGEALLRIRDTGEGMSEDELALALEPFRQIATAPLANKAGTGLGLPLTKALVEANRAMMTIRSARGEGTVVTVTFPPTRVLSE
jgi:PAS domain S-box-containing protein